jgi:xylan 1,4-beta-xylosidase
MFGSGRAILSLRANYRRDLREVKRATGFEYVRFHGILDRGVGFYHEDAQGQPFYNYSYIDQIYDGLLKQGIRPFVELSFMPPQLASTAERQGFWYHPYVSPPKSWTLWGNMIEHLARHLVARYGINEASQWYFEVWNEPNIGFWAGVPKKPTYFHLYDVTARALKRVSPRLRVGGPATAQAAWVPSFIRHCVNHQVPIDFVSTHVYGNDSAKNVFGTHQKISRREMVYLAVKKIHDQVKASPLPHLPIIFSEYNASYKNQVDVTDSSFMGPWLANTIRQCDGLVHIMSYWDFSDVFEEQGIVKTPFYGGFGLIAAGNIPKASYNDFRLLHMLGTERLAVDSNSALVTRQPSGALAMAVWNYAPPGPGGEPKAFELVFRHAPDARRALVWIVDRHHGSPLATWEALGQPSFPSFTERRILQQASQLPPPKIEPLTAADPKLTLTLAPHALALVELLN